MIEPSAMVRVVVAVICNQAGQFLIQQRPAGKPLAGYWEFPGGKIEAGEKPSAALVRELREELDIELQGVLLLHLMRRQTEALRLDFYQCRLDKSMIPTALEGQEWCWVTLDELTTYRLPPANHDLIDYLQNHHDRCYSAIV